jgi:hypothetical protein
LAAVSVSSAAIRSWSQSARGRDGR